MKYLLKIERSAIKANLAKSKNYNLTQSKKSKLAMFKKPKAKKSEFPKTNSSKTDSFIPKAKKTFNI